MRRKKIEYGRWEKEEENLKMRERDRERQVGVERESGQLSTKE